MQNVATPVPWPDLTCIYLIQLGSLHDQHTWHTHATSDAHTHADGFIPNSAGNLEVNHRSSTSWGFEMGIVHPDRRVRANLPGYVVYAKGFHSFITSSPFGFSLVGESDLWGGRQWQSTGEQRAVSVVTKLRFGGCRGGGEGGCDRAQGRSGRWWWSPS
jgi:hypothetical protein